VTWTILSSYSSNVKFARPLLKAQCSAQIGAYTALQDAHFCILTQCYNKNRPD